MKIDVEPGIEATFETILQKLSGVRRSGAQTQALCPAHDDRNPSLSLKIGDGRIVLKCHRGCSFDEICGALDIEPKQLFQKWKVSNSARGKMREAYYYRDVAGNVRYRVERLEPKGFVVSHPVGNEWKPGLNGEPILLYRLPELLTADKSLPVFICEGEKDVDNMRAIGLTATCNPFGAGKWKQELSEYLRGFYCVILPDNDPVGRNHADSVARNLQNTAEKVSIINLPGLKEKGDVSDFLASGNTKDQLLALVDGAEIYPVPDKQTPEDFFVTDEGVFFRGKEDIYICSPLKVVADTCDPQNENWGKVLEFEDPKGAPHCQIIPMASLSGDGLEVRSRLMNAGVEISPERGARQLFSKFIVSSKPKTHVLCVTQPGWYGDAFVLPDETIAPQGSGKKILLQNADPRTNKFSTQGSIDDWQHHVAAYCRGNSRLTFVVSIAFAASLLLIARESSGGFHFYGPTSTGKTTTLQVGASVLGAPLGIETWRGTTNGIEALATLHNHSVLFLDEISQVNAYEVGQTVYMLANGCGKARMNKDTTSRRLGTWLLLFVSSGEKTLEQVTAKAGERLFGGQEVRFVNILGDAGSQMGVFEDLHGFTTANQLAKHLSSASNQFYGTPNRGFLRSVCADIGRVQKQIQMIQQHFRSKPLNANGEIGRVSSRFAVIAAAGMLACDFGITKWDRDEVLSSVESILDVWIENRGTAGSFDDSEGVKHVLSFIDQHGSSRFQPFSDP